jgi:hypothetical protein
MEVMLMIGAILAEKIPEDHRRGITGMAHYGKEGLGKL